MVTSEFMKLGCTVKILRCPINPGKTPILQVNYRGVVRTNVFSLLTIKILPETKLSERVETVRKTTLHTYILTRRMIQHAKEGPRSFGVFGDTEIYVKHNIFKSLFINKLH